MSYTREQDETFARAYFSNTVRNDEKGGQVTGTSKEEFRAWRHHYGFPSASTTNDCIYDSAEELLQDIHGDPDTKRYFVLEDGTYREVEATSKREAMIDGLSDESLQEILGITAVVEDPHDVR